MADGNGNDLVLIGAVWTGKDRRGNTMLTGKMGQARLLVLKNTNPQQENSPDFLVYVAAPEQRENGGEDNYRRPAPSRGQGDRRGFSGPRGPAGDSGARRGGGRQQEFDEFSDPFAD